MYNTNIKFWKKTLSSHYIHEADGSLTGQALVSLGVIAAIAHEYFRYGLNIPGHHGLEWMTLLLFGRMQSRNQWAGLLIAGGAAVAYTTYAAAMPLAYSIKPVFVYLLNGLCVDLLFTYTPARLPQFIKGMILGGIAAVVKPIVFIGVVMLAGLDFGSFAKHGYVYPMLSHFAFGAVGGIFGIMLATVTKAPLQK